MPVLSTALAIAGIAASGAGIGEAVNASGQASAGQQQNIDIAQQELARKQQIFQQLQPFYSQYMQQGSPFLQNIQRAGAEQNAQQFGNAAGQLRGQMQTSGLGYGPSGTTAAALGQLGQGEAQSSANSYLQNLLNNEQIKFQAAQGLGGLGNMFNQQNTVGQPPAPTQNTIGSSVNAFGQSINNLVNQQNQGNNQGGNLPLTPPNPNINTQLTPPIFPSPTQGTPI
jgi:hypothetical protein